MAQLECQRHLFDLPNDTHFLNAAYMTPLLHAAREAGIEGLDAKRQPWHLTVLDFFEPAQRIRKQFARLIGVPDWERVAIVPAASYGLSTVAHNVMLRSGQTVVGVGEQFPSNVYPWKRLCEESEATLQLIPAGPRANERILDAITPATALVAMPHVHWATGAVYNLQRIGKRAREVGTMVVIDGTQSIGALPFDARSVGADAVVCAGYKWLMGPYSVGVAYLGPAFDEGIPLEENWIGRKDSDQFGGLVDYQPAYGPGAVRYDVGERSNFALLPVLEAGLEHVLAWQPKRIQSYVDTLFTPARLDRLAELGCHIAPRSQRAAHLFGIGLPEHTSPADVAGKLRERNVHVSVRGRSLRVSPHVYNTPADVDALIDALSAHLTMNLPSRAAEARL
ncbi:MAG: aminotransferase class V-fold PLP-dependent enzyme [Bacteroidota bacterium]